MRKFIVASAALAVVGFTFGAAEAKPLFKRGIQGTHCFSSEAAIAKEVWVEIKCKNNGKGASTCMGQIARKAGAPDRVLQTVGSCWFDEHSGTVLPSGEPRLLCTLQNTMRKDGGADSSGIAFAGLTLNQMYTATLDPQNGSGVWEGVDFLGIYDPTPNPADGGLPNIDPKHCDEFPGVGDDNPATCNGTVGIFNNAGTISYHSKGECPDA